MKNIIVRFLAMVICLVLLAAPLSVCASEEYNMLLTYSKENVIFSNLEINIYRIADSDLNKLAPYDSYPVQVKGITSQTEWSETAATLRSYIQADAIEPYMTCVTDGEGVAVFSGIDDGLYLVTQVRAEADGRIFTFYDFMILVTEDVSANPKAGIIDPTDEEKTYTVLKLWKDDGSKKRPAYVTVDILKDGALCETVNLDHVNNWSYSFKTDQKSTWSVVERNVPEGYYVVVTEKDTTFIITNSDYDTEPDDGTPGEDTSADTTTPDGKPSKPGANAPQTGDTFPMKRYMIMLCVSGMLLVILGFGMRRKDDAKSR